jgi:hypothetical protein
VARVCLPSRLVGLWFGTGGRGGNLQPRRIVLLRGGLLVLCWLVVLWRGIVMLPCEFVVLWFGAIHPL